MEVNYYFLGLVLFLLLLSRVIKPSKINSFMGYRTPYSMKSQETWDFGNNISRKYMLALLITCTIFHIVASFFIDDDELMIASIIVLVINLLSIVIFTEISLRAQFDVNGNRKMN